MILAALLLMGMVCGCSKQAAEQTEITPLFTSFRDIPGITQEEIDAIENLQKTKPSFIVGMVPSSEAFYVPEEQEDGKVNGFSALLCEWMSELFGIPFIPEVYRFTEILAYLETFDIDFTGSLTITDERRESFFIAGPITRHTLKYYRLKDSKHLSEIQAERLPRFALLDDSVVYDSVVLGLGAGTFEAVFFDDIYMTYDLLKSGEVDAFINEDDAEGLFLDYDYIVFSDFLPVFIIPIGLATQNPELEPVISVMQKALDNGGIEFLEHLNSLGNIDFKRAVLSSRLTEEERAFIRDNKIIPYVTQYRNYPMSFYNERENEWQGIAFDLLKEIEILTGISFQLAHDDEFLNWTDLLKMVEAGDAAFITELVRSEERIGQYIWPNKMLASFFLTLASRSDMQTIRLSEVYHYKVGVVKNTAPTETFKRWFPNHEKTVEFNDTQEAFAELGKGGIDLVMTDTGNLLTMINYLELTGFKANFVFDEHYQDSSFGFNKDQIVLRDIMDKALSLIDVITITENWRSRTFDYRYKLIEAQRPWLIGASVLFLCLIVLLFVLFQIKKSEGHRLEILVQTRTAELKDANAAKSKFLATMSHEIRTPMNVILGITDSQLSTENLSQESKKAFEKIFDSGYLLLNIINDILDLSKIESGKFELVPVKYESLSLINDAASINVMRIDSKQINFKLQVDENIPIQLFGDELRIKQVLNNILSNAFKYTQAGEIILSFAVEYPAAASAGENDTVILIIKVSDTGQGMTPEQVIKLFDEYSRFNMEANRTTVGTGLGMAITRNLVKLMNGEITVDTAPGKGSVFTVRIPQIKTGSALLGKETADKLESFNFSGIDRERKIKITREIMPYGKVLVVDDIPSNLDVAKLLLNPYQLEVDTAESGFEAIDIIKSGKEYDIIFMDHMMPNMDGIETTKKIREEGYRNTIVALTANAIAGQQEIFMSNGFDNFISKPIDIRQLNDILNRYVRKKGIAAAIQEKQETAENIPEIRIPGINSKLGLSLYGGDIASYLSVLRSYASSALNTVDRMRLVSAETLPNYYIDVHGLKGISASIGAEEVRDMAAKLETAAKAGSIEEVLAGNEPLLSAAGNLISAIKNWLAQYDSGRSKPRLPRADRSLLARLRQCCEEYDIDSIDEIMDELEKADYTEDADLVTWLKEKVNRSDFSQIVSRLGGY